MMVFKFTKIGYISLLGHLDTQRIITRTLDRMGVEIEKTEGFNPHHKIYFNNPIPLGVHSLCEYCTIANKKLERDFIEKFNANSVDGIKATTVFEAETRPNIAKETIASEYIIDFEDINGKEDMIENIVLDKQLKFLHKTKNKTEQKYVSDYIISVDMKNNKMVCIIKSGNVNLKASVFADFLLNKIRIQTAYQITKTRSFMGGYNSLEDIDTYLKSK